MIVCGVLLVGCGSDKNGKESAEKWVEAANEQNWDVIYNLLSNGSRSVADKNNWYFKKGLEDKSEFSLGDFIGKNANNTDNRRTDDGKLYDWSVSYVENGKKKEGKIRTFKENDKWKAELAEDWEK